MRACADIPSEGLVLILQQVLLLCGIPDPQLPRHVCGHNGVVRATLTLGPRAAWALGMPCGASRGPQAGGLAWARLEGGVGRAERRRGHPSGKQHSDAITQSPLPP